MGDRGREGSKISKNGWCHLWTSPIRKNTEKVSINLTKCKQTAETYRRAMGSTPEVGSSKITTWEPPMKAKATHILRFIPSDNVLIWTSPISVISIQSKNLKHNKYILTIWGLVCTIMDLRRKILKNALWNVFFWDQKNRD